MMCKMFSRKVRGERKGGNEMKRRKRRITFPLDYESGLMLFMVIWAVFAFSVVIELFTKF